MPVLPSAPPIPESRAIKVTSPLAAAPVKPIESAVPPTLLPDPVEMKVLSPALEYMAEPAVSTVPTSRCAQPAGIVAVAASGVALTSVDAVPAPDWLVGTTT